MSAKPITPREAGAYKAKVFPDFVIDAWNNVIASNIVNGQAEFCQNAIIKEILRLANQHDQLRVNEFTKVDIFDHHWLDVEDLYEQYGWKVEYKPAYNESYEPSFRFKRKN